jgi:hypothetical protein
MSLEPPRFRRGELASRVPVELEVMFWGAFMSAIDPIFHRKAGPRDALPFCCFTV